jgi:hypothetical protein
MLGDIARVKISDLRECDSPRSGGLDPGHLRVLAEADGPLPPISVHRATMRVIDGMHRLAAARLNGHTEIDAAFFHGTAEQAFCLGVTANTTHGLPLSLTDRRAAAERIIRSHPAMSDRWIARTAGLAPKTVAAIRAGLDGTERHERHEGLEGREYRRDTTMRVGADGRIRPLRAVEGRLAASQVIAARPESSLREIAREAGISLGTARDVRLRVMAGENPVPTGHLEPRRDTPKRSQRPAANRPPAEQDPARLLDTLRRDPALRYSESGRALLRWLDSRLVTPDEWPPTAGSVPAHCVDNLTAIARECARAWTALAEEIARY